MSTSTKKDIVRGKRYTPEEKSEIVSFVETYNAANGRGGQSAASTKFGVSQLTVATWLRNAGGGTGKAKPGRKAGTKGKTKSAKVAKVAKSAQGGIKGSMEEKFSALLELVQDITKLEKELEAKRSKFDALKASL